MRLDIRFLNGDRTGMASDFAEKILGNSLFRFRDEIQSALLYVEDINGPRGGIDKACRCVLQLKSLPPVVIHDKDQSIPALVRRVADRATASLRKKLKRRAHHRD